jgi:hypothetical protein
MCMTVMLLFDIGTRKNDAIRILDYSVRNIYLSWRLDLDNTALYEFIVARPFF